MNYFNTLFSPFGHPTERAPTVYPQHRHPRGLLPLPAEGPHPRGHLRDPALHRLREQGERGLHQHQLHHQAQHAGQVHRVVQERDDAVGAVAAALPGGGVHGLQGRHGLSTGSHEGKLKFFK